MCVWLDEAFRRVRLTVELSVLYLAEPQSAASRADLALSNSSARRPAALTSSPAPSSDRLFGALVERDAAGAVERQQHQSAHHRQRLEEVVLIEVVQPLVDGPAEGAGGAGGAG